MKQDCDVLIIGSGPAGVSAAFPLVRAGLRVLMVDGGRQVTVAPPAEDFLVWRQTYNDQSRWLVGDEFQALKMQESASPKLRVPSLGYVFEDFEHENQIASRDFPPVGSLATGGLSNAWGCGVARLSGSELASFPFPESDLDASYEAVTKRIGISGAESDDLSEYFGLDAWSQPPIELDGLHTYLLKRYGKARIQLRSLGFAMGRSRVAALTQSIGDRMPCDRTGNCLWGCQRRALYSSSDELPYLQAHGNFTFRKGFVVHNIARENGALHAKGSAIDGAETSITATKILLAAGTLATTRLVLRALDYEEERNLLSCPTAAFIAWIPRFLGVLRAPTFGLGQLSFTLDLSRDIRSMGSIFSTTGIPVSEFIRHVPMRNRYAADILCNLLSSCVVGNLFLPGDLSTSKVKLDNNGRLLVSFSHDISLVKHMERSAKVLRQCFYKMGAFVIPGSFTMGQPGSDIHYAGTLPMRHSPTLGETDCVGEIAGMNGVHVVDGACLSALPEKSHTLTIMANADRISNSLLERFLNS